MVIESIRLCFGGLPDPRCRRGRRHELSALVIIDILAVICCTDNWQEVAQFARASGKAAIHMISAWSSANGLVFGQLAA